SGEPALVGRERVDREHSNVTANPNGLGEWAGRMGLTPGPSRITNRGELSQSCPKVWSPGPCVRTSIQARGEMPRRQGGAVMQAQDRDAEPGRTIGVVRRLDQLGRVVVPAELRKAL